MKKVLIALVVVVVIYLLFFRKKATAAPSQIVKPAESTQILNLNNVPPTPVYTGESLYEPTTQVELVAQPMGFGENVVDFSNYFQNVNYPG